MLNMCALSQLPIEVSHNPTPFVLSQGLTVTAIEIQTSQVVTLNLSAVQNGVSSEKKSQTNGVSANTNGETPIHQPSKTPFPIPGISVSLARILGEQVMRSRVTFEER